jgi:flagellar hook-associated protein 2
MTTGSITTLGLGSGLDLQDMLDQLKEVDSAPITVKENKKIELQEKIDAYNSVNAKLFNIKSNALSLSLESDFLKTTVSISDEEIISATANDGIAASTFNIDVTAKARFNSWQSVGVASKSAVIYTEPETGIADANTSVTIQSETMNILYGAAESQETIAINIESDQSLIQIAESINSSDANKDEDGNKKVNASVEENNGQYYIRLSSAEGGDSVNEQVDISGFDYVKSDTTFSIARADNEDPMYISLAPGANYSETVSLINNSADNPGTTAAIIDTGEETDPYKFTLTSDATGEKHRISIQNLPMTEINGADGNSLNAFFSINGINYQRQSNEGINDVFSGVTLTLKKTGETNIGIQKNTETVKENILSLVENFNDLVGLIKGSESEENTEDSTEETTNPFNGEYGITSLMNKLKTLFSTSIGVADEYKNLNDIGIAMNRNGTLTVSEDTLDQAVASNPDAIAALFLGDADNKVTGIGDLINAGITDMISASGIVSTEIDEAQTKITRIDKDIETATQQLNKRYESMTESFVRLDTYIRRLNAESSYMQSMFDSINASNEK